jgi:hypothetical protein
LLVELPKNGRSYGLFWKPVDFGTQTITDGLAHFHRKGNSMKMLPIAYNPFEEFCITHLRNFGFHRIAQFHNKNNMVIESPKNGRFYALAQKV